MLKLSGFFCDHIGFGCNAGRVWRGSAFGGYRSRIDVPKLVERYMNKEIRVDEYVTDVMGLDDINKAFKAMTDGLCLRCVVLMP